MILRIVPRGGHIAQRIPSAHEQRQSDSRDDAGAQRDAGQGVAPPPQGEHESPDEYDQEHRAHRAGHDQEHGERHRGQDEDKAAPPSQGGQGHDGAEHRGSRVARPRREDPPGAALLAGGHGMAGEVLLHDEALELAAHEHAGSGMRGLMHDGDQSAPPAPRRREGQHQC